MVVEPHAPRREPEGAGPPLAKSRLLTGTSERAVLATLDFKRAVPASTVMERTGLTRPTVMQALRSLSAKGWTVEAQPRNGDRGRPAQRYRRRTPDAVIAGVDFGAFAIRITLQNLRGEILARHDHDVEPGVPTAERLKATRTAFNTVLSENNVRRDQVWLATAGATSMAAMNMTDSELTTTLAAHLEVEVDANNSAHVLAQAEARHGSAKGRDLVMLLWLGRRPTVSLVFHGKAHLGAHGRAGDLSLSGWMPESPTEGRWAAGSGSSRIRSADEFANAMALAIQDPEHHIWGELVEWFRGITPAIALVACVVDPDVIVLSGPGARIGDPMVKALQEALSRTMRHTPEVVAPKFHEYNLSDAAATGARDHVLATLIEPDGGVGALTRESFIALHREQHIANAVSQDGSGAPRDKE